MEEALQKEIMGRSRALAWNRVPGGPAFPLLGRTAQACEHRWGPTRRESQLLQSQLRCMYDVGRVTGEERSPHPPELVRSPRPPPLEKTCVPQQRPSLEKKYIW